MAEGDLSAFTIMVHLQLESLKCSFVSHHVLTGDLLAGYNSNGSPIVRGDPSTSQLLDAVLNGDAAERNRRFKLIPRIVEGPFLVKQAVRGQPVMLGDKVTIDGPLSIQHPL